MAHVTQMAPLGWFTSPLSAREAPRLRFWTSLKRLWGRIWNRQLEHHKGNSYWTNVEVLFYKCLDSFGVTNIRGWLFALPRKGWRQFEETVTSGCIRPEQMLFAAQFTQHVRGSCRFSAFKRLFFIAGTSWVEHYHLYSLMVISIINRSLEFW